MAGPNGAYVYDIDSGTLFDAGHPIHGAMPNGESDSPVLSADGRLVAFHSTAENLVGDDSNQTGDLFLRDLELDTVQLVSRQSNDGAIGNGPSNSPILSANGRTLGFRSEANNLTPGDYNFLGDLFVLTLPAIAPHLQFSAPPGPNRDFTVSFQSESGVMYLLQAATSLAPGKFQSLESAFGGDGSIISRRVPIANESGYVRLIQTVRALPNE